MCPCLHGNLAQKGVEELCWVFNTDASAKLPQKTCLCLGILAFAPDSGPRIAKRFGEWRKRGPNPVFDSLARLPQPFRSGWLELSGAEGFARMPAESHPLVRHLVCSVI